MGCSLHVPRGVADVDPPAKPVAPKIMVMVVHHRDNWYDKPNPLALKLPSSPHTPIAATTINCPSIMSLTPKRRFTNTNGRSSYPPVR